MVSRPASSEELLEEERQEAIDFWITCLEKQDQYLVADFKEFSNFESSESEREYFTKQKYLLFAKGHFRLYERIDLKTVEGKALLIRFIVLENLKELLKQLRQKRSRL